MLSISEEHLLLIVTFCYFGPFYRTSKSLNLDFKLWVSQNIEQRNNLLTRALIVKVILQWYMTCIKHTCISFPQMTSNIANSTLYPLTKSSNPICSSSLFLRLCSSMCWAMNNANLSTWVASTRCVLNGKPSLKVSFE